MRYLVTDPCYVINGDISLEEMQAGKKSDWDKFLNETGFGESVGDGYDVPGIGKIIDSASTNWGDGTWKVAPGKEVSADAGLVCIVQLEDGYEPTAYNGNATTDSLSEAQSWMRYVQYSGDEDEEEEFFD